MPREGDKGSFLPTIWSRGTVAALSSSTIRDSLVAASVVEFVASEKSQRGVYDHREKISN